jgi:hypothetical protein
MNKECLDCGNEFESYNGIQKYCNKVCLDKGYKTYFAERYQRIKNNPIEVARRKQHNRIYSKNPKRMKYQNNWQNKKHYERMASDPMYVLRCRYRTRVKKVLKTKSSESVLKYCGCTLEELKTHIGKQFTKGMSWEKLGEIHIDHIIPLASATCEKEIIKLCHYTNLQPLWAIDNLKKGSRI